MLHEPSQKDESPDFAESYKTILGVKMFFFYSIFYVGFIAINVISPAMMGKKVLFGLNLAVVYGFGLIISALILAVIYNNACASKERDLNTKKTGE